MKTIANKTKAMKIIENKYNLCLEELLRHLYVDEDKTIHQIAKELGIHYATAVRWLPQAGIYSHRLKIEEKG